MSPISEETSQRPIESLYSMVGFFQIGILAFVGVVLAFPLILASVSYVGEMAAIPLLYFLGFLILIGIQTRNQRKYGRTPIENAGIISMLERAKGRLGVKGDISLWQAPSDRTTFMTTTTLRYRAVVISEPAMKDMLREPESGETVLAHSILEVLESNPWLSAFAYPLALVIVWLFTGMNLGYLTALSFLFNDWLLLIGVVAAFILLTCGGAEILEESLKHRRERIEELYGLDLAVAHSAIFGIGTGFARKFTPSQSPHAEQRNSEPERAWSGTWVMKIPIVLAFFIAVPPILFFLPWMYTLPIPILPIMWATPIIAFGGLGVALGVGLRVVLKAIEPRYITNMVKDTLCEQVQQKLNLHKKYGFVSIRRTADAGGPMYILKIDEQRRGRVVYEIPEMIVNTLQDSEYLVPYLLAQMRLEFAYKMSTRLPMVGLFGMMGFMFGGLIWLMSIRLPDFLFGLLFPIVSVPAFSGLILCVALWKRRVDRTTDLELTTEYPKHPDGLRKLVEEGVTAPLEKVSFVKRLEWLEEGLNK